MLPEKNNRLNTDNNLVKSILIENPNRNMYSKKEIINMELYGDIYQIPLKKIATKKELREIFRNSDEGNNPSKKQKN